MKLTFSSFLLTAILAPRALADDICYNRISNGSFESGSVSGGFSGVGVGGTAVMDWDVTSGSIDYINTHWPAADGSRSIDMNGGSQGTILSEGIATEVCIDLNRRLLLMLSYYLLNGDRDFSLCV
jgi:hypothetical protein